MSISHIDKLADTFLNKRVRLKLFGAWREGVCVEVLDTICASDHVIVELVDGRKTVKVCAAYQAVRIVKQELNK